MAGLLRGPVLYCVSAFTRSSPLCPAIAGMPLLMPSSRWHEVHSCARCWPSAMAPAARASAGQAASATIAAMVIPPVRLFLISAAPSARRSLWLEFAVCGATLLSSRAHAHHVWLGDGPTGGVPFVWKLSI